MVRQYSPRTFFRNTPNALLEQYFRQREIDLGIDWDALAEKDVDPIFEALLELDPEALRRVEGDFTAINELACKKGVLAILEEARFWQQDWAAQFAQMSNAYERSFWTFLNEPRRFAAAGNFHELDRLGGWKRRMVGKLLEPGTERDHLGALEEKLRAFYAREGRGRFCHVDYYERANPERHCFFAYPEDFANTELGYDDDGSFRHRTRRSAFEVIFVYRSNEGVLEVHAKGGQKVIVPLMEIFCTTILGLQALPEDGRMPFDLTALKDRGFVFAVETKDRIESIDVLELKLEIAGTSGRRRGRVSVGVPAREQENLHDLIDEIINTKRVPPSVPT